MNGGYDGAWDRPPADPVPWVRVRGGAGGTVAYLEDLAAAAARLREAAARVDDAAAALDRCHAVVDATAHLSPGTAAWARTALDRAGCLSGGRLRARAEALDQAAGAYRNAEEAATALVHRLSTWSARAGGYLLGQAGPVHWVLAGTATLAGLGQLAVWAGTLRVARELPTPFGFLLRRIDDPLARQSGPAGLLGRVLGGTPVRPLQLFPRADVVEPGVAGGVGFVLGAAPGAVLLDGDGTAQAARVLGVPGAVASWLTGRRPRELLVARTPSPDGSLWRTPPTSTAGLLRRVGASYPASGALRVHPGGPGMPRPGGMVGQHVTSGGTVVVQELHRADGTSAWVVTVPGTQEWSPLEGRNPMDLSSNLAIMGGRDDDATGTLLRAMRGAGIGPDEPVVLAGHSQGGLAAMRAAADPLVREHHSIAAVLTAGSPVAALPLPGDVQALHLETSYDYVPTLDGSPNPDTPNRTTVQIDLDRAPAMEGWAPGQGAFGAHQVSTYAGVAAELSDVDHPSLRAFDAHLRTTLGDVTSVSTQAWTGVRVPAS